MTDLLDLLLLFAIKALVGALNRLPVDRARRVVCRLLRFALIFMPRHRRVARVNLKLAFPESSPEWREQILEGSIASFARVLVDSARLPLIGPQWVSSHVDTEEVKVYQEMKIRYPGKGVILATGHLGSFDLMGHCVPMLGCKIAFIVRNFKLKRIDAWFNSLREAHGNKVIARTGGVRETIRALKDGMDTAILFDQNVRASHAVFVDWFGVPAATTALPAMAALRLQAPVLVASFCYSGEDNYKFKLVECDFSALYADQTMSNERKVHEITRIISQEYEKMIRSSPEEWFWMHKRWRTRPAAEAENIYAEC